MSTTSPLKGLSSLELRRYLFQAAIDYLKIKGREVESEPADRRRNIRRVRHPKNSYSDLVVIKTSKNGFISFTPDPSNDSWLGLQGTDYVIISCLDDPKRPRFAHIHIIGSASVESAFSHALTRRRQAGIAVRPGKPLWLSLYEKAVSIGDTMYAGAGLLTRLDKPQRLMDLKNYVLLKSNVPLPKQPNTEHLSLDEARRGLALRYQVHENEIEITIDTGRSRKLKSRLSPSKAHHPSPGNRHADC